MGDAVRGLGRSASGRPVVPGVKAGVVHRLVYWNPGCTVDAAAGGAARAHGERGFKGKPPVLRRGNLLGKADRRAEVGIPADDDSDVVAAFVGGLRQTQKYPARGILGLGQVQRTGGNSKIVKRFAGRCQVRHRQKYPVQGNLMLTTPRVKAGAWEVCWANVSMARRLSNSSDWLPASGSKGAARSWV